MKCCLFYFSFDFRFIFDANPDNKCEQTNLYFNSQTWTFEAGLFKVEYKTSIYEQNKVISDIVFV